MRRPIILVLMFSVVLSLTFAQNSSAHAAQTHKPYRQMTLSERKAYIALEARNIALVMSGVEYDFTPEFETEIHNAVEAYAKRIGIDPTNQSDKSELQFAFDRGRDVAPKLISNFRAQNISPLIGLYIPMVESEYVNIQSPNSVGAIGMFQFLPKTGLRFGLTAQELLDVEKSANAAAAYISKNLVKFKEDKMKEALALLAYNRGEKNVERDLATHVNERNNSCSICAITSQREKLDETFQIENVYYVPRFFAAAIIGENPKTFGLTTQPLSSYETNR